MMNRNVLFWLLAAVLLTACEKGLVDGVADVAPTGQAANSVLQVRTRSGGLAGDESTVAYPKGNLYDRFINDWSSNCDS